jgi:transcription elongation factor Elf1
MCDSDSERDESDGAISESIFSCPACGQEISVNEEMKQAILANGCPVCATDVDNDEFED